MKRPRPCTPTLTPGRPCARARQAMGDKIMSKQIADRAMVNTIPGYEGEVDTVEQASKIGAELGYPIMLKASAGGGGTGLKMVRNESQVEENFLLARAEVRAEPSAPASVAPG